MNILRKISYGCTFAVAMTLCAVAQASSAKAASFQGLGDLPSGDFASFANDVSADGSTVVGSSFIIGEYEVCCGEFIREDAAEAFRWTQEGGIQGLGDLPGGGFFSNAGGVSADGSIVVGSSDSFGFRDKPFRWTQESGIELLEGTPFQGESYFVSGVSADGSIVVGGTLSLYGQEAFRWTENDGVEIITALEGNIQAEVPPDISGDGSIIVGSISVGARGREAVRLKENGDIERLGDLPGGDFNSETYGVSADGFTVVGESSSANGNREAFRWREEEGMQGLGDLPGGSFQSRANDASADGSTIVGTSSSADGEEAFIWDSENQMRSLQEILTNDFALDLTGWSLNQATAISDDGFTIVGNGINPDGNREAWIARVDAQPVPEPSAFLGTGIAFGFGMLFKKRKKKGSLKA